MKTLIEKDFSKTVTKQFINITLILILIFCCTQATFAQPTIEETHALKITARAFDKAIKLRWAPTSMYAWKACNEQGYVLERFTMRRGDNMLSLAERKRGKMLTVPALKPWTEGEQWRPLMEQNDYAAIAAQALYGSSFAISNAANGLVAKKDEAKNRYSFGLFAADQSVEVADALALYFEDRSVNAGEYYLYKIYPAGMAENGSPVDTGFVYIGADEIFQLPKVSEVETDFEDHFAYISWDKTIFDQFYSSYVVERSADGKNFVEVNAVPFVGMDKSKVSDERMLMRDSLESNDQIYTYRVKGKTIFDEVGPPSDPTQGMGINPKVTYPSIESILPTDGKLGIGWRFNKTDESEIAHFQLERSNNDQGPFEVISADIKIDKSLRYFIDENPLPVNYYRITALDKYGRELNSFAALAQLDDAIPPTPPINVRGTIMEDGTMVLSWSSNKEADIMGYRVYMANRKDREEYVQLTSEPARQNYYAYPVEMNTLSEEVFIKVRALDFRQNKSDFSEIATITRPDTIAPAAPVFVAARPTTKLINISWENSASADVQKMELERKEKGSEKWIVIKFLNFPDDIEVKSYQDITSKRGDLMEYRLKAIDDAGLITYSKVITASKVDNGIREVVGELKAEVDRKAKIVALEWNYEPDGTDLSHFEIYRGAENGRPGKYATIKKLAANKGERKWQYKDASLQMDTQYNYQIRAVYAKGAQSPLSKRIAVNY